MAYTTDNNTESDNILVACSHALVNETVVYFLRAERIIDDETSPFDKVIKLFLLQKKKNFASPEHNLPLENGTMIRLLLNVLCMSYK